jgi:hypothetical protein
MAGRTREMKKKSPHKRALSREDRKLTIAERRAKGERIRKASEVKP